MSSILVMFGKGSSYPQHVQSNEVAESFTERTTQNAGEGLAK
jgi:hypothetical protein